MVIWVNKRLSKVWILELRDDIRFTLSKLRWEQLIKKNSDLVVERPQEGDLVYFPTTKAFFEIQFVEHEQRSINRAICLFTNYLALDLSTNQKESILVLQR